MRIRLFIFLFIVGVLSNAQKYTVRKTLPPDPEPTLEDENRYREICDNIDSLGLYQIKKLVHVSGASSTQLYTRARTAISGWTGPDRRSEVNIDYSDKDEGIVIFKGHLSLGIRGLFVSMGWLRQANYVMQVQCKDNRAQITITVPTYSDIPVDISRRDVYMFDKKTFPIEDLVSIPTKKGKKALEKASRRAILYSSVLFEQTQNIISAIENGLSSVDDF